MAVAARFRRALESSLGKTDGHFLKLGGLLYALLAAGTAVANTTTETTSASVALVANELDAGTVLEFHAQGIVTGVNGTPTLTVKIKLGSTVVATISMGTVAANDTYDIMGRIVIRTGGASGTCVAAGRYTVNNAGTHTGKMFNLASTTVDTTGALTLANTFTWGTAHASNSARCDVFTVKRFGTGGAVASA